MKLYQFQSTDGMDIQFFVASDSLENANKAVEEHQKDWYFKEGFELLETFDLNVATEVYID